MGKIGPPSIAVDDRAEISTVNDPTRRAGKEMLEAHTPNADDHLAKIRETIDRISLQNRAINETALDGGIAEAESVTSESLAALI